MNLEEKKQRARENAKRYYQKNKEKILKRQKEYTKKRYKEDEEFREKIKEKNRNYAINNLEKVREIKRKSQYKYMNKKRLSGELPVTQKMLIENLEKENARLKDIFEKSKKLIEVDTYTENIYLGFCYLFGNYDFEDLPTKIKEVLKEEN